MQYEVEQKFPAPDLPAVRGRLLALGATFEPPIEQADRYFAHPTRDFARTDEALRLRQVGNENFITYKGPKLDAETKTRHEIELPLAPGPAALEQFSGLLMALGFGRVLTVRKHREPGHLHWDGQIVHVALDRVPGLGDYVELEIIAHESSLAASKLALESLVGKLELGASERRSYLEMLLENST